MTLITEISLHHYLFLGFALFFIGLLGVLIRKNVLVLLMSIELMLNACNLILVSTSQYYGSLEGQIFAFFVMTIAAAEAGVGLALAVQLYRRVQSINSENMSQLRG